MVLGIIVLMCVGIAGCEPTIDVRGYNLEDLNPDKIVIGKDTQDTIREKFGTPILMSTFPHEKTGGDAWYYVSKIMSTQSFFKPKTLEQRSLTIVFDTNGIVRHKNLHQGDISFRICEKETPVRGCDVSVMQDIFGGFGRRLNEKSSPDKKS